MQYKLFGSTGTRLSAFGFGGSRFRNGKSIVENAEIVQYAIENGVNHFDSGPGYANSEAVFGLAVKGLPRDSFCMSCKNQPAFYQDKTTFLDELKRSLEALGLTYLDFYYMWNVKRFSEYEAAISIGHQYEALLAAKREGLVRHICLSSHLDAKESIQIINDGKIEGILLNLNILNFPYTIEAAARAKQRGIGVGLMSPLYGGQIPQNEERLTFLQADGLTPTEAALRFAGGLWCADYAYISFGSKAEIAHACRIANRQEHLDDAAVQNLRGILGAGLTQSCCGCGYCMPYCPNGLPIAEYMTYYNRKSLFGVSQEDFEGRLGFHRDWFMLAKRKADAKDCIQCGRCEAECTQHIPIMKRMAELAEIEANIV